MTSVLISKLDGILAETKIELRDMHREFDEKVVQAFNKVLQRDLAPNLNLSRRAIIGTYLKNMYRKHINSVLFSA